MPETLSSLICYTPHDLSTPSPTLGHSESLANYTSLQPNQPIVSEEVFLPSLPQDPSNHHTGNVLTNSISSWWSPCSYLPLPGFDYSGSYSKDSHSELLQRVISRLCALASVSRERIIYGESQPNIDRIDSILALGSKDSSSPAPGSRHSQNSLVTSTTASNYECYIMEPLLLKIDALLNMAQGMEVNEKKPGK